MYLWRVERNEPKTQKHKEMNIQFTNNFTGIANAGDTEDVQQTAQNFINAVREMIEAMYPLATVVVADGQQYGPRCVAYGFGDSNRVEQRIMEHYQENEFAECWA